MAAAAKFSSRMLRREMRSESVPRTTPPTTCDALYTEPIRPTSSGGTPNSRMRSGSSGTTSATADRSTITTSSRVATRHRAVVLVAAPSAIAAPAGTSSELALCTGPGCQLPPLLPLLRMLLGAALVLAAARLEAECCLSHGRDQQ